jgi:hypothetical protein
LYQGTFAGHGNITGASIISSAMITGGVYNQDAQVTPQTNKLVGIFAASGCKTISNTFISGIQEGVISLNAYWTRITDLRVWRAGGTCLDVGQGNAITVDNVAMWYSTNGIRFDGDASQVRAIHTEQVAKELTIFRADCCTFGPGYLEDADVTSGAGTYAITLGYVQNSNKVISCKFENLRVGNARPSKQGLRIWDTNYSQFVGCRLYSTGYVKDTNSYVSLDDCDFASTTAEARTRVTQNGSCLWPSNQAPNSDYTTNGPWLFNLPSVAIGTITTDSSFDYDYTLPVSLNNANNAVAIASWASGGSAVISIQTRVIFSTPKKIRITFTNTSASSVVVGTAGLCLCVFAGI